MASSRCVFLYAFHSEFILITIYYVDAPCGAGKTYSAVARAKKLTDKGRKVLLVQPTNALIGETMKTVVPKFDFKTPPVEITSTTFPCHVIPTLDAHLKTAKLSPHRGELVLITHAAFFGLPSFAGKENWTVIIDEIPAVDQVFDINVPHTHAIITEHIEVEETYDANYTFVRPRNTAVLRDIAFNEKNDAIYAIFEKLAAAVVSPFHTTLTNTASYRSLTRHLEEDRASGTTVRRKLTAHSIMQPTRFADFRKVIIMGACFQDSMLYRMWSRLLGEASVEFIDITQNFGLRYAKHENGGLIDIYYATTHNWSKVQANSVRPLVGGGQMKAREAIETKAKEVLGSDPKSIWTNNDAAFEEAEFVRMPTVSHGLNAYASYHKALLIAALNPPPVHFKFLRLYADIKPEEVQTAMTRQALYQACCRLSIRDPKNLDRKKIVVPDLTTAEWLHGMFEGSSIHAMNVFSDEQKVRHVGRPKKHVDDNARAAAYRANKRHRDIALEDRIARLTWVNTPNTNVSDAMKRVAETMQEVALLPFAGLDHPDAFQATFFADTFDKRGVTLTGTFDDLVWVLADFFNDRLAQKDDGFLMSPAHYVSPPILDLPRGRGRDNLVFARHIVLDNDGGDLTWEQFAEIFPDWRMVIYSTFSTSAAKKKWRVLIPTDRRMDFEGYKLVTSEIIRTLNSHGYWTADEAEEIYTRNPALLERTDDGMKLHGFDIGKLSPASIFYVPCHGTHPSEAFFMDLNGSGRGMINVETIVRTAPIGDLPQVPQAPTRIVFPPIKADLSPERVKQIEALRAQKRGNFKQTRIDAAIARWQFLGNRPGCRDEGVRKLAFALVYAGCDEAEAKQIMRGVVFDSAARQKIDAKVRYAFKKAA